MSFTQDLHRVLEMATESLDENDEEGINAINRLAACMERMRRMGSLKDRLLALADDLRAKIRFWKTSGADSSVRALLLRAEVQAQFCEALAIALEESS